MLYSISLNYLSRDPTRRRKECYALGHLFEASSLILKCSGVDIAGLAMSRICVKNLPKYVVEDQLRELFEKREITDVKLIRTKDGRSRQLAFIGFRTEHQAQEAIKYFNNFNNFNNKPRNGPPLITCEVAKKFGDTNLPRPWSRHSENRYILDANKHARVKGHRDKSKDIIDVDDPQLQDFLQVMQPRAKSKLWANDASDVGVNRATSTKDRKAASDAIHPIQCGSVRAGLPNNPKHSSSHKLEPDEVISDMDYFKSRMTKEWSDSEGRDDDVTCQVDATEKEGQSSNPGDKKVVFDSNRLFVRNLPYTTTEQELLQHVHSELLPNSGALEVHLLVDKDSKQPRGMAFIIFSGPEFAARALKKLHCSCFQGRWLDAMLAEERPSNNGGNNVLKVQKSKTVKQQREEEKKAAEASGDTRAWKSLFMSPDTVMETIARAFSVRKSDILGPEADDVAVHVALGEAKVISDTKESLRNAGVNVESLEESATKRSNHVILVKNLPYGSTKSELEKMFGKFGRLEKIILPSTKTLALVVFLEPAEAKAAFRGVTYKRYKDALLYLEWAPSNVLSQSSTSKINEKNSGGENGVKQLVLEQIVERTSDVDVDPDRVESRSLYVKNLNFKTTDESLREHFSKCIKEQLKEGAILSAKVMKHLKNGKNVSTGFGFVEFDSMKTAINVCRSLQESVLDGHMLSLQPCHIKDKGQVQKTVEKDRSSTKLFVGNVAFEATKKELEKTFGVFGELKSVRLPRKFGGGHKGYAFVEYLTEKAAQDALATYSKLPMRGRPMVVERANLDESLDELRAKAATQLNGFQNATKLSMKRKRSVS
ncbi:hypothetical protein RJT34_04373 [Clitoria ternatea]|uniref:RRM domain-containing protein n=1 Tax=Clitoria ternatea TaxID=43366 RepID=A0AAN9KL62_CLITE